jgi:hypothetical protein
MKTYLWLAQRVFALSAFVASGQGTLFVYDQQSATSRDLGIGGVSIQQMQPMGQSFIPGLSSVGFVQFEFTDFNPGNGLGATVYVNLLADSITGTVLDSTAPVFMPDGVFASVTSFLFATPAAVAPGTTYYLQPIVQSGDHWDVVGGNYGYAGGTLYALGAPSGSGTDLWFREGVIIPEPPSGLLVLLGIAGICAFRWGRRFRARYLAAILVGLLASAGVASAQFQIGERVWSPPWFASYHSMQRPAYPPLPRLPFDLPVYRVVGRTNSYVYDDRAIAYAEIEQAQQAAQAQASLNIWDIPTPDVPSPLDYGTNLWLDITDTGTNAVIVTAHNVEEDNYFQLLSKTNLVGEPDWTIQQQVAIDGIGGTGMEDLTLAPVPEDGHPETFFWAAQSKTLVKVVPESNAIRPGSCYAGQPGIFTVQREGYIGSGSPLTVRYRVSGTATNGVDYTYLSGVTILPESYDYVQVAVAPLASLCGSNLTLTVTLVITNDYLADPRGPSATILIEPNVFSLVATDIANPIGLDYHTLTDSLLVSVDPYYCGSNFVRIDAQGSVSHWADVYSLSNPTPIATVKATANGFHEGATYFCGFGPSIGWLSTDANASIKDWAPLQRYESTLGGLYVDQTGTWGGDLIATTGGDSLDEFEYGGGVWRITSGHVATQVVDLVTCLGGVITLTNDPAQWGPWAGKIITGQNYEQSPEFPEIYAIDTAGQVLTNATLGIQPEQINLIPPNQSFYFCDTDYNAVWEIPSTVFTNHVGQLLMTGPGDETHRSAFYIVHYDAGGNNEFVVEKIDTPEFIGRLEQGAFAPLTNMPCLEH